MAVARRPLDSLGAGTKQRARADGALFTCWKLAIRNSFSTQRGEALSPPRSSGRVTVDMKERPTALDAAFSGSGEGSFLLYWWRPAPVGPSVGAGLTEKLKCCCSL
jgi:hypothetical protein